jgi:hypothetical protein
MSADASDGADDVLQMFGGPGSLTAYGCGAAVYDQEEIEIDRPTRPTRPQPWTHRTMRTMRTMFSVTVFEPLRQLLAVVTKRNRRASRCRTRCWFPLLCSFWDRPEKGGSLCREKWLDAVINRGT